MKGLLKLLTLLSLYACSPETPINKVVSKQEEPPIKKDTVDKPYSNPALIYGSDFISFLAQLSISEGYDTLLYFTSAKTKKQYTKDEILNWCAKNELQLRKKLLAIHTLNANTYLLTFRIYKYTNRTIGNYTVSVEQDTCRLLIDINK